MSAPIDLTGQRFGRWIALRRSSASSRWVCVCECGVERDVYRGSLRSGVSTSCGCVGNEKVGALNRTHGMSGHPAHISWQRLRHRCNSTSSPDYPEYGGRGIKVCPQWEAFEAFWADMGPTWAPGLSIDRIDNDGDYEPGNCRWADGVTQANNKRNNRWIETPRGPMTLAQAAREFDINYDALKMRVKLKWPMERIFQLAA